MTSQKKTNILAQQAIKDFLEQCGATTTTQAEKALSMLATVATTGVVTIAGTNTAVEMLETIREIVVDKQPSWALSNAVYAQNPTLMTVEH